MKERPIMPWRVRIAWWLIALGFLIAPDIGPIDLSFIGFVICGALIGYDLRDQRGA